VQNLWGERRNPGRLFFYLSHGIHVCANVSCGPDGTAAPVLLRVASVQEGIDVAQSRRGDAVRSFALARASAPWAARLESVVLSGFAGRPDDVGAVGCRTHCGGVAG
jgi:hypothetical protein